MQQPQHTVQSQFGQLPVGLQMNNPLVLVEHLSRVIATRGQKTTILDDVSFSVPTQSLFAINGPSGSGKSTLLNMLTGVDRPTSGRVDTSSRIVVFWPLVEIGRAHV